MKLIKDYSKSGFGTSVYLKSATISIYFLWWELRLQFISDEDKEALETI